MDIYLHEAGHSAHAHQHLPPSEQEQQDGGAGAQQTKDALFACGAGPSWHSHLPWVLLGTCAVTKEKSAVSSAELVRRFLLNLPGSAKPDPPHVDVPLPPT